jgi:hypothetical protein
MTMLVIAIRRSFHGSVRGLSSSFGLGSICCLCRIRAEKLDVQLGYTVLDSGMPND